MYCENCGNELIKNEKLCNGCGCKNTSHYGVDELKKAFKYIKIFLIAFSAIVIVLLSLSVYGSIKSDKISDSFEEMADELYEYWSYEYNYGVENDGADLYREFNGLSVDASITNIHYEKSVIFFGITLVLLIVAFIATNVIYKKKISKADDEKN